MLPPFTRVALDFAQALVDADYDHAFSLLTPELQQRLTPAGLREQLYAMFIEYEPEDQPREIHVDEEQPALLTQWPAKQPDDLGWLYVGITGENFVEGIAVTVTMRDGRELIRAIEWGRP